jgi:hypothetical protein
VSRVSVLYFYFALVSSKVEYASVVWNSITSTDANKLERIQQKFTALCFKRFFLQADYCYGFALELKLHILQKRRYHLDARGLSKKKPNFLFKTFIDKLTTY